MSFLKKAQALAPKRLTKPLPLPEFESPLLVAEMSSALGMRLRSNKVELQSEDAIRAMMADMIVNEDGTRMFTVEEIPQFLDGLSLTSATELLQACTGAQRQQGGADSGNR